MPSRQSTTDPGTRSETHGRFGKRRTDGNLDSFDTPARLQYVQRGNNDADDKAAQVRHMLLDGTVNEHPAGEIDLDKMRTYHGIPGGLQNPLKYDYVNITVFGPNLKPPIIARAIDDPDTEVDESLDIVINEGDTITHTYGAMGTEPGANRKQPFQTSNHDDNREFRPIFDGNVLPKSGVSERDAPQTAMADDPETEANEARELIEN